MMSSSEEKEAITNVYARLTRNLNATEIKDQMKQAKILTALELEAVGGAPNGQYANAKLLSALQLKQPGSLDVFIGILKNTEGSQYIGDYLGQAYREVRLTTKPKGATSSPQQLPGPLPAPVSAKATGDSSEKYRMMSTPRGVAVIISNKIFSGNLKRRDGTDKDVARLQKLFAWLDFKVHLFKDLTGEQMVEKLRDVSRMNYIFVDCLVVAVLTHGKENKLYGTNGQPIAVAKDLFKPFDGSNCPTLVGKPKVFIIQACRGSLHDCGVEFPDGAEWEEPTFDDLIQSTNMRQKITPQYWKNEMDGKTLVPTHADMVAVYATVPGYVSWRNKQVGSWFIKAFVEIMFANAAESHFMDIITKLNNQVAKIESIEVECRKQMSQATTQLTKQLFFNPASKQ